MRLRNLLGLVFAMFVVSIQLIGCQSSEPPIGIGGSLPATGTVGTTYSGTLTASGGSRSYTWTVSGLPAGVTSSGTSSATLTVSGTPTTAGSYTISVMLTDSHSHSNSATYPVVISSASTALAITGTLPATGTVGTAYNGSLTATGGSGSYSWTITGLPANVTASNTTSATVTVAGTPNAAGTSAVVATVTDTKGTGTATYNVSIVVSLAPLTLEDSFPNTGTVGVNYAGDFVAHGGSGSYTWVVTGLPTGVVPTNGTTSARYAASGAPTAAGNYKFSATVTDTASNTYTYKETIVVSGGSEGAVFTVAPTALGTLTNGTPLTPITLTSTPSGTQPYMWTISSGALPTGVSMTNGSSSSTTAITSTTNSIQLSGTPSVTGPYSFTLSVQDSASPAGAGTQAYSGTVSAATTSTACAAPASGALPTRGNESAIKNLPMAFELSGTDGNGTPIFGAGSITGDGTGAITDADVDVESATNGPSHFGVAVAKSSYSYDSNNRGCLFLSFSTSEGAAKPTNALPPSIPNLTLSFSFSSGYLYGAIQEFDYTSTQTIAAGQMHQQTASDFSFTSLAPNFAFGMSGYAIENGSVFARGAIAGSFTNTSGAISLGTADFNVPAGGGASGVETGGTGSLEGTTVSPTTGRGTGLYKTTYNGAPVTFNFVYYIINSGDVYIISDDTATLGNFMVVGRALKALATSADLNGYYIPVVAGIDTSSGTPHNVVTIGTMQAGSGIVSKITTYSNDAGTYGMKTYTAGSYELDPTTGRVTFGAIGTTPPVAYLTDPAVADADSVSAFLVGTDDAASSGFLALQGTSAPNFSNSSLSGEYTYGTRDEAGKTQSEVAEFDFTAPGAYSAIGDLVTAGESASQPDVGGNMGVVAVTGDGSGSIGNGAITIVTNGPLIVGIDESSAAIQPTLYILVAHTVAP
jgi:hypothetical protein